MGHPAEQRDVLPFVPRRRCVVLKFDVGSDDDGGGLFPEGERASSFALWAMQRDRDYAESVHAGGAFDAALERARVRCLLRELEEAGAHLRVEGETLWVSGPQGFMTDELAAKVRENKALLMAALGGGE